MAIAAPRVLFYTENIGAGGSERYLRDLVGGMRDRDLDVRLGCNPDPELLSYLRSIRPGLQVDALPVRTPGASAAIGLAERSGGERSAFVRRLWPAAAAAYRAAILGPNVALLARWIAGHRPDVLHINNGGYPGGDSCRAAVLAGRLAGVPVVAMAVHNLAMPYTPVPQVDIALDRLIATSADTIIAFSQASATTLIRRRQFPRRLLTCIPYGIEPASAHTPSTRRQLGLPEEGTLVGMVGRLEPRKGQRYLLEAMAEVLHHRSDLSLVFVGSGPDEAELRALAGHLGIAPHVIFTGFRDDVAPLLQALDIFVMSSVDYESMPFALLEAMHAGKPIIGTRVAGIPEALADGACGLLVEPANSQALAGAVLQLLDDPALRQRLGNAAVRRASAEYSLGHMLDATMSHYERLRSEKDRRTPHASPTPMQLQMNEVKPA